VRSLGDCLEHAERNDGWLTNRVRAVSTVGVFDSGPTLRAPVQRLPCRTCASPCQVLVAPIPSPPGRSLCRPLFRFSENPSYITEAKDPTCSINWAILPISLRWER
jgi:hypothetical protein